MSATEPTTSPAGFSAVEPGEVRVTTLNKRWLWKMYVFLLAMLILGFWGMYDAIWLYPRRGLDSAEYLQKTYLEAADKAGTLTLAGVKAPAAELARLDESAPTNEVEVARQRWLQALSLVRDLGVIERQIAAGQTPTPGPDTSMPDPKATLEALSKKWSTRTQPTALSPFDIPVQYLFMAIGLGLAVYLIFFLFKCSRTRFRYEPGPMRLTLPDGRGFVPADIEDVDRRLWHKFFVELKVRELGAVKLDLLRYWPLEEWFLEMEKHAPGYVPPAPADAPPEPAAGEARSDEQAKPSGADAEQPAGRGSIG